MTTDLYSTVFFQDGEQLTFDDLNNGQRFLRAQLTDQILQQLIGDVSNAATRPEFGGDGGANASGLWAYSMSPGRAFLRQGSANNKIQLAPGTLFQKSANNDGADSTLVPFSFVGTEEWTLASGDATNPRVDVLQMKLEYITDTLASVDFQDAVTRANTTTPNTATRRRIQCTLSVKTGTPAASPTIPDPDTGFVPVGTAVVGHGWTSAGAAPIFGVDTAEANKVVIHDQRMPLGVRGHIVTPLLYMLETAFSLSAVNTVVNSTNATNLLFAKCPVSTGRLLAMDVISIQAMTSVAKFVTYLPGNSPGQPPSGNTAVANGFGSNTILGGLVARSRRIDFEAAHTPLAGPTILSSATNKIGVPLWASGLRTPTMPGSTFGASSLMLRLQNIGNGTAVYDTTWWVAS